MQLLRLLPVNVLLVLPQPSMLPMATKLHHATAIPVYFVENVDFMLLDLSM